MTHAMRKRVFLPIFILFVCFPLIIFALSFTKFFNNELRSSLTSIVENGTNARLYLGDIHGSVFGRFSIDGAALYYGNSPIVLIDTIEISHLPLSLITKTIEVLRVRLVRPRFFLTKFADGSFNVDHIGKGPSKPGGKFGWTLLLKSVDVNRGEFYFTDMAHPEGATARDDSGHAQVFNPSSFHFKDISLSASGTFTNDNLTVMVRDLSLKLNHPDLALDSLSFDFFTSESGTELSGLKLYSGPTLVHADVTIMGTSLLDSMNADVLRRRHIDADVEARNLNLSQIENFVNLPLQPRSGFSFSLLLNGDLDTLNLSRLLLETPTSNLRISGRVYDIDDSAMHIDLRTDGSRVDMAEISALLGGTGAPDFSGLGLVQIDGSAIGASTNMDIRFQAQSTSLQVSGTSHLSKHSYEANASFRGVNIQQVLGKNMGQTYLNGTVAFSLLSDGTRLPEGRLSLSIDSSRYRGTDVHLVSLNATSTNDSVSADVNAITSNGNIDGHGSVNLRSKTYSGEFEVSELNAASFVPFPPLQGSLTGRFDLDGSGFDIDSLKAHLSFMSDHSELGDVPLGNSAIAVVVDTKSADKELKINSSFLDASATGRFEPHKLPSYLSLILTRLADKISSRITGHTDSVSTGVEELPNMNVTMEARVKDARLLGRLIGNVKMSGNPQAHLKLTTGSDSFSLSGSASLDSLNIAIDSLEVGVDTADVRFGITSDRNLSLWTKGNWFLNGSVGSLGVNGTTLGMKMLRLDYTTRPSESNSLAITALGSVNSFLDYYIDASGGVTNDTFKIVANSILGKLLGVTLTNASPVDVQYSPRTFSITPADFLAEFTEGPHGSRSNVQVAGSYSFKSGTDLKFLFDNVGLRSLQRLAGLDTNSLKLTGSVSGHASVSTPGGRPTTSIVFTGREIAYNNTRSKLMTGDVELNPDNLVLDARISSEDDSTVDALHADGTIPLSEESSRNLQIRLKADSLNISFLTPFLPGVENLGGRVTGEMAVSGNYSVPNLDGNLSITDGRIRLAANEIDYLFDGTIVGKGNRLQLSHFSIRDEPGQPGGTMAADGSLTIARNTISEFDIGLNGSLLVLNSTANRSLNGIYGSAVIGSGREGLRLEGSMSRPLLDGSVRILNSDLTLLPLQRSESSGSQDIIYRFAADTTTHNKSVSSKSETSQSSAESASSGSFIDSLRYNVDVETQDNMSLRMIFNPVTNDELDAILGGRLHLSNLSGSMELTGDVDVQNNSYYDFYGKQFAATGKLRFTGDPLNPTLDITAQYQGDHYPIADTSTQKGPQTVVVTLRMTGTFDKLNPIDISMTVDNAPFQGDPQTNAMSFIVFNQFESELTSAQKQSFEAAGAGVGTSLLSGALTSYLSRELPFIRGAEVRYNSTQGIVNPDIGITGQFGNATVRVATPLLFNDISNTDLSIDYPLASILGNRLYLQLSRRVSLNNRYYYQRETVNMMRLFYQLSF